MRREHSGKNRIKRIMEGRAARICAVTAAVFLCIFTLLEYTALRMEWDIPVIAAVSGERGLWSEELEKEELALDDSTENVLLEEAEALKAGETAVDETGDKPGENGAANDKLEKETATAGGKKPGQEDIPETGDVSQDGDTGMPAGKTDKPESSESGTEAGENGTPAEAADEPALPYYIRINRKQNCITIYTMDKSGEYTVPYKAVICSTGLYNATPRGTFKLSTKYLWRELYGGVYGQYATRIHGGVLFHSVPYYRKSKSSLCTDKYNKLGQQASMGCVRLTVEDAKWIAENCPEGTVVEIYDDDDPGPLGKPEAAKIDTDSPNKGWDPTDPDTDNPWHEMSEDE